MTFANVEVKSLKKGVALSIRMISISTLIPKLRVMKYNPGIIIRKISENLYKIAMNADLANFTETPPIEFIIYNIVNYVPSPINFNINIIKLLLFLFFL